jgi:hypothetical protein
VLEQRRHELEAQEAREPFSNANLSIVLETADADAGKPPPEGAAHRYAEFGLAPAPLNLEDPSAVEALVRRELCLSEDMDRIALERIRRRFARRHHPDLVDPAVRNLAQACMTIANTLIDEALLRARSHARP